MWLAGQVTPQTFGIIIIGLSPVLEVVDGILTSLVVLSLRNQAAGSFNKPMSPSSDFHYSNRP